MTIATVNPATGKTIRTFEPLSAERLSECLDLAAIAYQAHRRTTFANRAQRMQKAAAILDAERRELGRLMTLEMGKPITAGIAEAEKCATACRYYAENAENFLADHPVEMEGGKSWVAFQPIGVVLAIMPWNFPFWQVFRFAAPALMAGNVGVLKHSSNVPQCALAIEDVFRRAGFADGVFQTLLIGSDLVDGIVADKRISAVTLTGSEAAGRSVAGTAGKNLKKSVMELGGSDPFIVMPSADLEEAVSTAVTARMINNGQSCIAAKRFIIHEKIYDEFLKRFVAGVSAIRIGDPMDEKTQLGPLATEAIRDGLDSQVRASVAAGARLLTGGKKLEGDGYFYAPTVLADIPPSAPAAQEELFGPVASVFKAKDLADAIRIANGTSFGLGASAWTRDAAERDTLIAEIESGLLFINGMVASDPRLPFGGVKNSGFGRELGEFGIREFVNIKSVRVVDAQIDKRSATE
ncbi:MAG: succinate-semialdehyde dehydrogenase / glutarate-semialdehyde dehydrogenase [Gemmatimonadaceae bacterium]|jgi:succinate-semialdehyde dehydrogenase/glutarate-semialdehyde dehydrogenase|nr:succinate-semialdehyde dehydrogenase / glutarate-semialdehyde dehydrogenase [Gemmatimonadaceae bacterium]